MASKKLIILSLFAVVSSLFAETAADYVHRGAQKYIFGQEEAAEAEVATGLAKFPNDPELQELAGLVHKKKPPPQNQQQQQQQQQNQQQQQPGETPSPSLDDEKRQGPQPSPSPGERQGEESPSPGEGGENETPSPSPGEGEEGNATPSATPGESKKFAGEVKGAGDDKSQKPPDKNAQVAEAEPEKEGQMSERQAEALLESMKDEEARVQLDERRATRHVYKDW